MAQTDMLAALMSLLGGGDGELRRPPQGNGPMPNRISPMQPAPGTSYSPQGVGDFMMDPQGMLAGDAKPNPMKQALDGYAAQMAQGGEPVDSAYDRGNAPGASNYGAQSGYGETGPNGRLRAKRYEAMERDAAPDADPGDEAMMKYVGDNVGGGETVDQSTTRDDEADPYGGEARRQGGRDLPGKFKEKRKAFPGDELDQDSKDEDMQHPGDRWPYRR